MFVSISRDVLASVVALSLSEALYNTFRLIPVKNGVLQSWIQFVSLCVIFSLIMFVVKYLYRKYKKKYNRQLDHKSHVRTLHKSNMHILSA